MGQVGFGDPIAIHCGVEGLKKAGRKKGMVRIEVGTMNGMSLAELGSKAHPESFNICMTSKTTERDPLCWFSWACMALGQPSDHMIAMDMTLEL